MLLPGEYINIANGNFNPVEVKSSIRQCFCIEVDGSKLVAETNSKQALASSVLPIACNEVGGGTLLVFGITFSRILLGNSQTGTGKV